MDKACFERRALLGKKFIPTQSANVLKSPYLGFAHYAHVGVAKQWATVRITGAKPSMFDDGPTAINLQTVNHIKVN